MEKYKYLLFDIIFFMPAIIYFLSRQKKILKRNKGMLVFAIFFGIIGFFLVDPLAVAWNAWGYNYQTTLGIIVYGKTVVEELLWAIFVAFLLGCAVAVLAEHEDKTTKRKW